MNWLSPTIPAFANMRDVLAENIDMAKSAKVLKAENEPLNGLQKS